jgi:hypothetical protein
MSVRIRPRASKIPTGDVKMLFEFPSRDEWKRLMSTFSFERWDVPKLIIQVDEESIDIIDRLQAQLSLPTWEMHLVNKLSDTRHSYGMAMFYFELGIPDEEWMISPGKSGASIEYFPHFEERHHLIKYHFDYYSDVFYYKAFSAWDTIGQLLNEVYQLHIPVNKVDFKKCIQKLKDVDEHLHSDLQKIWNAPNFEQAREIRNSIVHRHPANRQGPSFGRPSQNAITFGGCTYTPSQTILSNIKQVLELLALTIEKVIETCSSSRKTDEVAKKTAGVTLTIERTIKDIR